MNRKWAFLLLPTNFALTFAFCAHSICFAAANAPQQEKQESGSQKKAGFSSLTGCVDEQDGRYVLVDDRTLTPIASLEADGFPMEAFAKHLGHKVTVRGTSNSQTGRLIFKVRKVDTVSETCAPKQQ